MNRSYLIRACIDQKAIYLRFICVLSFSKVFNREKTTAPQATFTLLLCSPNVSRASYPQARALAYEPMIKLYLICNNG